MPIMTLKDFIAQYTGIPDVGNTPDNKGECVGLVSVWMDTMSIPHVWGHAKDLFANAPTTHFKKISNSSTIYPIEGDVICMDASWGNGFGHTGVVTSSDPMSDSCKIFEQNRPFNSPPRIGDISTWNGVIGWLRPYAYTPPVDEPCEDILNELIEMRKSRDKWKSDYADLEKKYVEEIKSKDEQVKSLQLDNSNLSANLTDLTLDNSKLRSNESKLQDGIKVLEEDKNELESIVESLQGRLDELSDGVQLHDFSWGERFLSLFKQKKVI